MLVLVNITALSGATVFHAVGRPSLSIAVTCMRFFTAASDTPREKSGTSSFRAIVSGIYLSSKGWIIMLDNEEVYTVVPTELMYVKYTPVSGMEIERPSIAETYVPCFVAIIIIPSPMIAP